MLFNLPAIVLIYLVLIALIILLTGITIKLVVTITSCAILFSRASLALMTGYFVGTQYVIIADSSFLNFVAWSMIFLGIIYLLALLPRVDISLRFCCTILISVLLITILGMIVGDLLFNLLKKDFEATALFEIIIKIICLVLAIGAMFPENKKTIYTTNNRNMLLNLGDRILASLFYGIAVTFLALPLNAKWEMSITGAIVVLVITSSVAFAVDVYLTMKSTPEIDTYNEYLIE